MLEILLKTDYQRRRFYTAFYMSLIAFVISIVLAGLAFTFDETTTQIIDSVPVFQRSHELMNRQILMPNRGQRLPADVTQRRPPPPLPGIPLFTDIRLPGVEALTAGELAIFISSTLSVIATVILYRRDILRRDDMTNLEKLAYAKRHSPYGRFIVAAAVWLCVTIIGYLFWMITGLMTTTVRLDWITATILTALYSATMLYAVAHYNVGATTSNLLRLGIFAFATGLLMSALSVDDSEWWRNTISYLGYASSSGLIFGVSLIITGLVMFVVLLDLLAVFRIELDLENLSIRSYRIIMIGGFLICLSIIGIGVFPVDVSPSSTFMHNLSIYTAVALLVTAGHVMRFMIRDTVHPAFNTFSNIICVVNWTVIIIFLAGRMNFVTMEFFTFALFVVWIYVMNEFVMHHLGQQNIEDIIRETMVIPALDIP